jgi:hypothetical protein
MDTLHSSSNVPKFLGLGLNLDETVVFNIRPSDPEIHGLHHKWYPGIHFVTNTTYLDVILGPDISTDKVFQDVVDKFFIHTHDFGLSFVPPPYTRIFSYTIFFPILYYLPHFYFIPYREMIVSIHKYSRKAIVLRMELYLSSTISITRHEVTSGPFTSLRNL